MAGPEIPEHLLERSRERRAGMTAERLNKGTNYFDAIDANTELVERLLGVLSEPLRMPADWRPAQQEWTYNLYGTHPGAGFTIKVGSNSQGVWVRLLGPQGEPVRYLVWPWSDEPLAEGERP
jgi:hypothetical protein